MLAQAVSGCFAVRFGIPCGVLAVGLCLAPTSGASTAVGIFRLGRFRLPPMYLGGWCVFPGRRSCNIAAAIHISFGASVVASLGRDIPNVCLSAIHRSQHLLAFERQAF